MFMRVCASKFFLSATLILLSIDWQLVQYLMKYDDGHINCLTIVDDDDHDAFWQLAEVKIIISGSSSIVELLACILFCL